MILVDYIACTGNDCSMSFLLAYLPPPPPLCKQTCCARSLADVRSSETSTPAAPDPQYFSLVSVKTVSASGSTTRLSERYGSTSTLRNLRALTLFSKRTSRSAYVSPLGSGRRKYVQTKPMAFVPWSLGQHGAGCVGIEYDLRPRRSMFCLASSTRSGS